MRKHIDKRTKNKGSISFLEYKGQGIELERKRIKNLYLKVLPPEGRLYVSAPIRMPIEAIKDFLLAKEEWIRLQQEKVRKKQGTAPLKEASYLTGEEVPYWGRCIPLEVRFRQRKKEACFTGTHILLMVKKGEEESRAEERYSLLKQLYREELTRRLPELFAKWEGIIGVKAKEWNLRDMTSRWGSCNVRQKKICLNLKLAGKAPECLEYVVVHELVHLLEGSHNHIFKAYMDQYLPGWRNRKAKLNSPIS